MGCLDHQAIGSRVSLPAFLPEPGLEVDTRWARIERAVALISAFVIGTRFLVATQITLGYLLAFALTPLWLPLVRRTKLARVLFVCTLLALLSGVCLVLASAPVRTVVPSQAVIVSIELAGVVATAGTMFWVLRRISISSAVAAYAIGMLMFVNVRTELFSVSPWRFGFALPVTLLALALVARTRRPGPQILVLATLSVASVLAGSRSPIAIQILALLFVWRWSLQGRSISRSRSVLGAAVTLGLVAAVIYTLGQALLLEGFLGESAQQRTQQQVELSGTVILGGRPEIGATVALMLHNPWGFGPGVMANWYDIQVARNGMAALGYDPANGYVDNFLFGDVIRLHSVFGELWGAFGLVGLLLAGVILWTAIAGVAMGPRGHGDALLLYLCFQTLWNVFFSPWYTSVSVLVLLLPLVWMRVNPPPGQSRSLDTA